MGLQNLISGAGAAVERAIDRFAVQPRRDREWAAKTASFVHRNDLGLTFELDPREYVDRHIFKHGVYERRFLDFIAPRFPVGAVALDIGANIGNHVVYLARRFAQIHAFEPNPTVLKRLHRNIELNGVGNVTVHPVGLGNETAVLPFRDNDDGNLGGSGFLRPGEEVGALSRKLELKIEHADSFIAALELDRIDFIKMDVEGWEPSVFEGLTETIARFRPMIAFEFHGQAAAPDDFSRIVATLPGYILAETRYASAEASLGAKLAWNLARGGRPGLERVNVPEQRSYENLLAFPDERSFARFTG